MIKRVITTILIVYSIVSAEIITIADSASGKKFKVSVVTPSVYNSDLRKRFPVIYLLHGYSGNHTTWGDLVNLQQYADRYSTILVCPDGDYNSWYLDSPVKKNSRFGTYFIKSVIPYIDAHYRTIAKTDSRAIIGSSMGGYGAVQLLCRYPDYFCGAGSISGIMDLTEFPNEWEIEKVLGPYSANVQRWKEHSIPLLISNLRTYKKLVILDCGYSDFALKGNRSLRQTLLDFEIAHEYWERPGYHHMSYPQKNLEFHLLAFYRHFYK